MSRQRHQNPDDLLHDITMEVLSMSKEELVRPASGVVGGSARRPEHPAGYRVVNMGVGDGPDDDQKWADYLGEEGVEAPDASGERPSDDPIGPWEDYELNKVYKDRDIAFAIGRPDFEILEDVRLAIESAKGGLRLHMNIALEAKAASKAIAECWLEPPDGELVWGESVTRSPRYASRLKWFYESNRNVFEWLWIARAYVTTAQCLELREPKFFNGINTCTLFREQYELWMSWNLSPTVAKLVFGRVVDISPEEVDRLEKRCFSALIYILDNTKDQSVLKKRLVSDSVAAGEKPPMTLLGAAGFRDRFVIGCNLTFRSIRLRQELIQPAEKPFLIKGIESLEDECKAVHKFLKDSIFRYKDLPEALLASYRTNAMGTIIPPEARAQIHRISPGDNRDLVEVIKEVIPNAELNRKFKEIVGIKFNVAFDDPRNPLHDVAIAQSFIYVFDQKYADRTFARYVIFSHESERFPQLFPPPDSDYNRPRPIIVFLGATIYVRHNNVLFRSSSALQAFVKWMDIVTNEFESTLEDITWFGDFITAICGKHMSHKAPELSIE